MTKKAGGEDFFLLNDEFNFQAIKFRRYQIYEKRLKEAK
jgi:hypothetical protein